MARPKKSNHKVSEPLVPATTPEGREQQLTELAMNLAERHLREGTASSAEIVHFLKRASSRERLEESKLRNETAMLEAKTKAIGDMSETKKMFDEAMRAMKSYQYDSDEEFEDDITGPID